MLTNFSQIYPHLKIYPHTKSRHRVGKYRDNQCSMTVCTWDLQQQHFSSCIIHVTMRHAVAVQGAGQMPPSQQFPPGYIPPRHVSPWIYSHLDMFPSGHIPSWASPPWIYSDILPSGHVPSWTSPGFLHSFTSSLSLCQTHRNHMVQSNSS